MKQALSLVEVLISIMLISIVIVSILQIKENNLYFLEKGELGTKNNTYLSAVALETTTKLENKNIYLSDKIDFKDDDIRKVFKTIKIHIDEEMLKPTVYNIDNYSLTINIKQSTLSLNEDAKKIFYRFKLGE